MAQIIHLQNELRLGKQELLRINEDIKNLQARKTDIQQKISSLELTLKSLNEGDEIVKMYEADDFEWTAKMNKLLKDTFNIETYRPLQKAAINATMSGLDCILILPTGAGKSLCFQLPAVMTSGITLVISPLISLMEDQLQSLNTLQVPTKILNSSTSKEESKEIFSAMIDPKSNLKMLYVTPEKLAKSKRFLSQLQKMYNAKRFPRLVIDEVHCCSQWGHDFRPDYKFLNIMKGQFPKITIIGLTATATPNVIIDVQKILNIEGSLVLKGSFYRENLKYEVIETSKKDKIDEIADLIKSRFSGQTGIIYCLTIKDTEDVSAKLRSLGIRATHYHAQLDPKDRTSIQSSWYKGKFPIIVATVAFGMGINKLDVRFVIHYSISKSVENYYQETGRAGRDGLEAHCILYFQISDVFRATQLMMQEKNGLRNVYKMLSFAINLSTCRKELLAEHFGDKWDLGNCNNCDSCNNLHDVEDVDMRNSFNDILRILENSKGLNERLTPLKLLDAWDGKGAKKLRVDGITNYLSRSLSERLICLLLLNGFLKEDFLFTPYSTISYIVPGNSTGNKSILFPFKTQDLKGRMKRAIVPKEKNLSRKKAKVISDSDDITIIDD